MSGEKRFPPFSGGMQYTEIKAYVGQEAELPCRVDTLQCGKLHSVKWYRDTSRIYVFSQVGGIKRGEGGATERLVEIIKDGLRGQGWNSHFKM